MTDFARANFNCDVYFYGVNFSELVNFTFGVFNKRFILSCVKLENLSLKGVVINSIDCIDIEIINAANRETFLVLKNAAIKQNDSIKALEFHTKEYNKYLEELKTKNKEEITELIDKKIDLN